MSDFGINYTQSYAYDLSKDIISVGEVFDNDVIEQIGDGSVESMLSEYKNVKYINL